MSVTEITIAAASVAGLGMIALLAVGWRKPARAVVDPARARLDGFHTPVPLRDSGALPYQRPAWWRRLIALGGGIVGAIAVGAAFATVVGFGVAKVVITLTHLLKR